MESCSNQKSVKLYFIFEVLQIATLCIDDSFAQTWHSLNQLHELHEVHFNEQVCLVKLFCGISFLLNAFEPISCVLTR